MIAENKTTQNSKTMEPDKGPGSRIGTRAGTEVFHWRGVKICRLKERRQGVREPEKKTSNGLVTKWEQQSQANGICVIFLYQEMCTCFKTEN